MKWYNNLSIKYLKENKKRTLVTIIGIILSVSLMCGITTIMESYKNMEKESAIKSGGNIHVTFNNVTKDNIKNIINDTRVENYTISSRLGAIRSDEGSYGVLNQYEEKAFDILPAKIMEGRYPKDETEILITSQISTLLGKEYKIGDEIELNIGDRKYIEQDDENIEEVFEEKYTKKFTIVGIGDSSFWDGSGDARAITYFDPNNQVADKTFSVSTYFNNIKNIHEFTEDIAKSANMKVISDEDDSYDIVYNENLLRLFGESKYGNVNSGVEGIVAMVIILISIITIVTIYNAFNISIMERKKQFGILNSLGATEGQIKNIVIREAMFMSIIAIPLGLFIGTLGVRFLFNIVMNIFGNGYIEGYGIEIVYSLQSIILAIILSLITIFISALMPAMKAAKISPIEAIKNTGDFKVKKVRKNPLISLLFGFEGELAYKNLKRNRKKFRITLFSLVVSMVIFLAFSGYIKLFEKSNELYFETSNIDFRISPNDYKKSISEEFFSKVRNIDSIKEVFNSNAFYMNTDLEEEILNKDMPKGFKEQFLERNAGEYIQNKIMSVGNESLKHIKLSQGNFNIDEANNKNGVILVDSQKYRNNGTIEEFRLTNYKIGDKIKAKGNTPDGDVEKEFEILAIAENAEEWMKDSDNVTIITTDEIASKIDKECGDYVGRSSGGLVIEAKNNEATRSELKTILKEYGESQYHIYDAEEDAKDAMAAQMLIKSFIYVFIIIISTISITNVINTINTNFKLRKREFAMIQSTGITPGGFRKMVYLESIYYSMFALLYGVPISVGLTYIMHQKLGEIISFGFIFPWKSIILAAIVLLLICIIAAYMPMKKMEKESIVDNIKDENI